MSDISDFVAKLETLKPYIIRNGPCEQDGLHALDDGRLSSSRFRATSVFTSRVAGNLRERPRCGNIGCLNSYIVGGKLEERLYTTSGDCHESLALHWCCRR
jgi:hypothetical protein